MKIYSRNIIVKFILLWNILNLTNAEETPAKVNFNDFNKNFCNTESGFQCERFYYRQFKTQPVIFETPRENYKINFDTVIFSDCYLSSLPLNLFDVFHKLKDLSVKDCKLKLDQPLKLIYEIPTFNFGKNRISKFELSPESKQYADKIEFLNLENNRISSIEDMNADFTKNNHLEHLDLSGNRLTKIFETDLEKFTKLNYLYLTNNDIVDIAENAFHQLTNLKDLRAEQNEIETLPNAIFDTLTELKFLFLENNKIKNLKPDWFKNLNNIEVIDFADNKIEVVDFKMFENLRKLEKLYLHNNKIVKFENSDIILASFPYLDTFYINDNDDKACATIDTESFEKRKFEELLFSFATDCDDEYEKTVIHKKSKKVLKKN